MRLAMTFADTKFPMSAVRKFYDGWLEMTGATTPDNHSLSVSRSDESWEFDDLDEFYSEYDKGFQEASFYATSYGAHETKASSVMFSQTEYAAKATVEADDRTDILKVINILRESKQLYEIPWEGPRPETPRIFIGHGRSTAWDRLYRHLKDQHGLEIFAFETEERAGQTIQSFLEESMHVANFALMVMTADDSMQDGGFRARQNVVHETGLFQGRLGWSRVLLIAENGIESYSNLAGTQEIRFDHDGIETTTGRILAVLRKNFPHGL